MSERFWMVKGEGPAVVKHGSREIAMAEAERLARGNPGVQFFLLEAVGVFQKADVRFTALNADYQDFPF